MDTVGSTRNDIAWGLLFEKYRIVDKIQSEGKFHVSSRTINEFREARLMTKFDDIEHLPALFRDNKLAILPTSRGDYVIAPMVAYHPLASRTIKPVKFIEFPDYLESVDYHNITSEATAINCAYVSGMLQHFLGEDRLCLTVSGRMGSGAFGFTIDSSLPRQARLPINVKNAQIEIDGGFEGTDSLTLIEAKNTIPYSFLVRQLYYPFRLWQGRLSKPIRSVFLTYANRIFHLYEYQFGQIEQYNSIRLLKDQRYTLEPNDIHLVDIHEFLLATATLPEPQVPFPQADSFERVINLCELLHQPRSDTLSHEEITTAYNFVGRQTHYYTSAGIYLGLIEKERQDAVRYRLSEHGKALFKKSYREQQLGFAQAILQHAVFAKALEHYFPQQALPDANALVAIMKGENLHNIDSDSTYKRRARTVRSWLEWIVGLQHS